MQARVFSKIHITHPAGANLRADFVPAKFCSGFSGHLRQLVEHGRQFYRSSVQYASSIIIKLVLVANFCGTRRREFKPAKLQALALSKDCRDFSAGYKIEDDEGTLKSL